MRGYSGPSCDIVELISHPSPEVSPPPLRHSRSLGVAPAPHSRTKYFSFYAVSVSITAISVFVLASYSALLCLLRCNIALTPFNLRVMFFMPCLVLSFLSFTLSQQFVHPSITHTLNVFSLPTLASRLPELSPFTLEHQRIFVRTFNIRAGGVQCLASYAWVLSQVLGVKHTHITMSTPVWDARYTANITLIGEGSRPGDIVINHEYFPSQPEPSSGIKQFIVELGDIPKQSAHSMSKFLGHGFYTRDFLRSPATAMLRIFSHPAQWSRVPSSADEVRLEKENLILVDDEGPNGVFVMLKQRLPQRWPDLKIVELKGFSSDELVSLYRRAKVYVDGGMRGLERSGQEALLYFVVPILEFARNGQNEFDYPLPSSLKYDFSRNEKDGNTVQNRMEDVEAKVEAVLGDWWGGKNFFTLSPTHPPLLCLNKCFPHLHSIKTN
jgi:hypothetical protein